MNPFILDSVKETLNLWYERYQKDMYINQLLKKSGELHTCFNQYNNYYIYCASEDIQEIKSYILQYIAEHSVDVEEINSMSHDNLNLIFYSLFNNNSVLFVNNYHLCNERLRFYLIKLLKCDYSLDDNLSGYCPSVFTIIPIEESLKNGFNLTKAELSCGLVQNFVRENKAYSSLETFRQEWHSTGGKKLAFNSIYTDKDDVYRHAVKNSFAPSTQRALKSYENNDALTNEQQKDLRKTRRKIEGEVVKKISDLFSVNNLDQFQFDSWEFDICKYIRDEFHASVPQYTYGNAQKWVNLTFKYILSSSCFTGTELPFKYCHIPIDRLVQKYAHNLTNNNNEKVLYLSNENEYRIQSGNNKSLHSWGQCDVWDNIQNYQLKIREAIKSKYYSPLFWEISTWLNKE